MYPRVAAPLLALILVAGCTGPAKTSTNGQAPGGTLVIAEQADIGHLISVVSESAADGDIDSAINFPMVDADFDCSLKYMPGIAKSWQWSDDGKVLSMTLRDDITFSDGVPLTAKDVKFTYDLIADPKVASPRISFIERMKPDGRPKVIDDTHIEWDFTEAYDRDTQLAHTSSVSILPEHILGKADRATLRGNPYDKHPLATGPFKLASYEPNTRIVLEPNEKFTGPPEYRPHLARVIFSIIPEYSTRLIELQNGDVDFMQGITVSDADMLREKHPEIRLVRRGYRSMDYVAWNETDPMFQDLRVRKALAMAVDVKDMISKVLTSKTGEAYAKPAIGTITPGLCGVYNDKIKPLAYDPDGAKKLLADAGWVDRDGDGYLDKDGKKFEFTLTTNTGNKRRADTAILIQAYLQNIGVKVDIEKQESNTFFDNLRKKDYQAALSGWSAGLFVDPSTIWHSDVTCGPDAKPGCKARKYPFNFVGYSNPVADQLMDQGLSTPDPAKSAPIWKHLQQVIYDDQPYMFLWWMDEIDGINSRFQDTQIDMLSALDHLYKWRVPPDKIKYRSK